jgi:hypothetical protein
MSKNTGPVTVSSHVIDLAEKHFGTGSQARDALRKAVEAIPADQLRNLRAIHLLLMA